jgi:hypothetical protein
LFKLTTVVAAMQDDIFVPEEKNRGDLIMHNIQWRTDDRERERERETSHKMDEKKGIIFTKI